MTLRGQAATLIGGGRIVDPVSDEDPVTLPTRSAAPPPSPSRSRRRSRPGGRARPSASELVAAFVASFVAGVILASGARAGPPPSGPTATLTLPGRATATVVRDIDGDGRADIVCAAARPPSGAAWAPRRVLAVFLQRADGSFGRAGGQPDQVLSPAPSAALFDLVDVLPDPGVELIEIDPERVTARRFDPRRRRFDLRRVTLVASTSFFGGARSDRIPFWNGAVDLRDRRGQPASQGVVVVEDGDSGLLLWRAAASGEGGAVERMSFREGAHLADITSIDSDPGVIAELERSWVRPIPFDPRSDGVRSVVRRGAEAFHVRSSTEWFRRTLALPEAPEGSGRRHVLYRDLDGDDICDPVAFFRHGLSEDKEGWLASIDRGEGHALIRSHVGGPPAQDAEMAAEWMRPQPGTGLAGIVRLGSLGNRLQFADVDGDDVQDLVVTTFGKGMIASLSEQLLDTVTLELRVFRFDGERRTLQGKPFSEARITLDRDETLFRRSDLDVVRLGDLDGDGRGDLVVFGRRRLLGWPGRVEKSGLFGWFGEEVHAFDDGAPLFEVALDAPLLAAPYVGDVDGDGCAEVIATSSDRIAVVRTRRARR